MASTEDLAYLLKRAIPDALDPIVRQAVGAVLPRTGVDGRYKIAYAGAFSSRVAADLLAFGRNQRFDGALIVIDADVVRALFYRGGRVIGATSDFLFERFGRVLMRSELVDVATGEMLLARESAAGVTAAATLVAPEVARFGLETQVWEIAAGLFLVHGGHFILVDGMPDLGELPALDLSPTDLALEGLRRYDEWRHGAAGVPKPSRRAPETRPPEAPPAARTTVQARSKGVATEDLLERLRALG